MEDSKMKTLTRFLACVALMFYCCYTQAQTILPGGYVTGNLTKLASPYHVMGDLTVQCGKTLYLQGGVTLIFEGDYSLDVYGSLKAMGSDESPILFTKAEGIDHWGGVHIYGNHRCPDNMHSRLQYVTFEYASAENGPDMWDQSGGALYIAWDDRVTIRNCVFRNNYAVGGLPELSLGGGAIALDRCSPKIEWCQFYDNICEKYGGAIGMRDASPEMKYNIFVDNSAGEYAVGGGAALFMQGNSNPKLQNETYLNNTTEGKGGALLLLEDADPFFINSLFWGNTAEEGSQVYIGNEDSDPAFRYCDIEEGKNGFEGVGTGLNYSGMYQYNIDRTPLCMHASGTEYPYQLTKCSPCIDAGDPACCYNDPDGTRCDIGAMYYPHSGVYLQEPIAEGVWSAVDAPLWVNTDLRVPENASLSIDPGVEVIFLDSYGLEVRGSLNAVGTQEKKIVFRPESIDKGWKGIRILPESASSPGSELSFCVIEHGIADGEDDLDRIGGGVLIHGNNNVVLSYNVIRQNRSTEFQGEYTGGGGVAIIDCSPKLMHNEITENYAAEFGGGVGLYNASPVMHHNLVTKNSAGIGGGGIALFANSNPLLTNLTVANNKAYQAGGGLMFSEDSDAELTNNILWYNTAAYGNQVYLNDENSDPDFYYNDIEGGWKDVKGYGTMNYDGDYLNNIELQPAFRTPGYGLWGYSPCIDAGDPKSRPDPDGTRTDIGAYYYHNKSLRGSLGLDDNPADDAEVRFRVFPLPAIDILYVEGSTPERGGVLQVYNTLGQLVRQIDRPDNSSEKFKMELNVSDFDPGTYILRLVSGGQVVTKKMIKR